MSYTTFNTTRTESYDLHNQGVCATSINPRRQFAMIGQRIDASGPSVHDFIVPEETRTSRWPARFDEIWNVAKPRAIPNSAWELKLINKGQLARIHDKPDMNAHDHDLMSILCSWENGLRELYLAERARGGGGAPPVRLAWDHVPMPKQAASSMDIYHSNSGMYDGLLEMVVGLKEILHDHAIGIPLASDLGIVPDMPDITPVAFARRLICRLSDACFGDWIRASIIFEREPVDARRHVSQYHGFRIKANAGSGLIISWRTRPSNTNGQTCSIGFLYTYIQLRRHKQHGIDKWLHEVVNVSDEKTWTRHSYQTAASTIPISTIASFPLINSTGEDLEDLERVSVERESGSDIDISDMSGLTSLELLSTFISTLEDISEIIKTTAADIASGAAFKRSDHYLHDGSDVSPGNMCPNIDQESDINSIDTLVVTEDFNNDDNKVEDKPNLDDLGEHSLAGNIHVSGESDDGTDNASLYNREDDEQQGHSSASEHDDRFAHLVATAYQYEAMLQRKMHLQEISIPLHLLNPDHPDWPKWLSRSDHTRWATQGMFDPTRLSHITLDP